MSNLRNAISDFLEGFGPGYLFSNAPRRGAYTQVFATDDVPCDAKIQTLTDNLLDPHAFNI
jgi:hypothetical protein